MLSYDDLLSLSRDLVLALKPDSADNELMVLLVATRIQAALAKSLVQMVKPQLTVVK